MSTASNPFRPSSQSMFLEVILYTTVHCKYATHFHVHFDRTLHSHRLGMGMRLLKGYAASFVVHATLRHLLSEYS